MVMVTVASPRPGLDPLAALASSSGGTALSTASLLPTSPTRAPPGVRPSSPSSTRPRPGSKTPSTAALPISLPYNNRRN
ncbi:hypothetical protein MLD38_035757 [Melastoma candidum]|uniref:Uncharacterized protein n=1 Tax=Melastoma candidum TaxID=119954 RepID=A0ACB9LHZ5_9MYRT|nr:hypothetical protein MLD38_035757 [Melastoma candidum]